jgi:hypothetical protein
LAQQCEQRTIGGAELGPLDLAAQHLELVAQDRDLDVLGMLGLEATKQEAEKPAREEVEKDRAIGELCLDSILAAQRTRPSF